jgi:hypothetical protein
MTMLNDGADHPKDELDEELEELAQEELNRQEQAALDAEVKAKPDDGRERSTQPAKRRRKTASGDVVIEDSPELSVKPVSVYTLEKRRPGFDYRYANPSNLQKYIGRRGWKVCDHPEVLASMRDGIDGVQLGTVQTTRGGNGQVLLCRPKEVSRKVAALKEQQVEASEGQVTRKYKDEARKIRREAGRPERDASVERPDFTGLTRSLVGMDD